LILSRSPELLAILIDIKSKSKSIIHNLLGLQIGNSIKGSKGGKYPYVFSEDSPKVLVNKIKELGLEIIFLEQERG
jgi:hypothetical protein